MGFSFPENPNEIVKTLYGCPANFSHCVGFCKLHNVYVTENQLKKKECLSKNCKYLLRTENKFWRKREAFNKHKKAARKAKRLFEVSETKPIAPIKKSLKPKRIVCLDLEMCELTFSERKNSKGLVSEVIQIGAVMLDKNYNCISEFSILVKPMYGTVSEEITNLTGITNEMILHADTFSIAMHKLYAWIGDVDATTYCWSDSDYKQLFEETFVKAKNHKEYFEFYRNFIDLQATFGNLLNAKYNLSLDKAMKLTHLRFKGQRHNATADAFNTARVLHKICTQNTYKPVFNKIWKTKESEIERNMLHQNQIDNDSDMTSTFASFMSPELLKQFSENKKPKRKELKAENIPNKNSKTAYNRYGIEFKDMFAFSFKMLFIRDMKNIITAEEA